MRADLGAQLIDSRNGWLEVLPRLEEAPSLAVDVEADGFHRYPEQVALVQLATPDGTILLVDPLPLHDLGELGSMLAEPYVTKILHSADYDVRSLDRDFGFRLSGLFDTAIAAQFCGSQRTGLGNVLGEYLGLDVPKPKRLQRLDWSRRPLPDEALDYAAGDVAHLHDLRRTLARRLDDLGRTEWVAEECSRQESVRYAPPDPPEVAYLSVRGARKLSGSSLAVLKELYLFREHEALRIGEPPYRVMSNQALISLASRPTCDTNKVKGVRRSTLAESGQRLEAALRRGLESEPIVLKRNRTRNPWSPESRERLARLKSWRNDEAERLELDRGIVWPAGHLSQIALHSGAPSHDLDDAQDPAVREWQWQTLGPSLEEFRTTVLGDSP